MILSISGASCEWNHTVFVLLCLAFFLCMSSHIVAYFRILFLFKTELCSIVCTYHILFLYLSVDGHLGCYYLLAVVKNASNMSVVSHRFCAINYNVNWILYS